MREKERETPRERVRSRSSERREPEHLSTVHSAVSPASSGNKECANELEDETHQAEDGDRSTKKVRIKEPEGPDLMMESVETQVVAGGDKSMEAPPAEDEEMQEQSARINTTSMARKSRYRDMLTGGPKSPMPEDPWEEEEEPVFEDGDIQVVEKEGKKVVELSEVFMARLQKPWEQAMVVKLMGRNIGYRTLKSKIDSLWQPKGPFKLIDLENNYFVVRFWDVEDFHRAPLEGPWTIFTHVLSVQPWSQLFRASSNTIDKVVTWVRFVDFPLDRPSSSSPTGQAVDVAGTNDTIGGIRRHCEDRGEWMNAPRRSRRPPKRQADGHLVANTLLAASIGANRFQVFNEVDFSIFETPATPLMTTFIATHPFNNHATLTPSSAHHKKTQKKTNQSTYQQKTNAATPATTSATSSKPTRQPLKSITNTVPRTPKKTGPGVVSNNPQQKAHTTQSTTRTLPTPQPISSKHSAVSLSEINHKDIVSNNPTPSTQTHPSLSLPPNAIMNPVILNTKTDPPEPGASTTILTPPQPMDITQSNHNKQPYTEPVIVNPIEVVDLTGQSQQSAAQDRGVWLLWDDASVSVQILCNHTQFIHARISKGQESFIFIAIYASPQDKWRGYYWRNIEVLVAQPTDPWLVARDFNAVLDGEERKDRFDKPGCSSKGFVNCVNNSNLIDLGFNGGTFTWKRGGYHAPLGRLLFNNAWKVKFQKASVLHHPYICSDHRPVVIKQGATPPPKKKEAAVSKTGWNPAQETIKFPNQIGAGIEDGIGYCVNIGGAFVGIKSSVQMDPRRGAAKQAGVGLCCLGRRMELEDSTATTGPGS
ncbi:hypothetical protein Tsubulata_017864 [Turnera subulata]|uniref:DUF4283 domain-containing protein n=1 Tax=Turnera subulata TaxID=218843 RepID=A0A9Q0FN25_9ROSI|nr:hypothetical protein Tsubulata_017864 [Turnera subulata]